MTIFTIFGGNYQKIEPKSIVSVADVLFIRTMMACNNNWITIEFVSFLRKTTTIVAKLADFYKKKLTSESFASILLAKSKVKRGKSIK